MGKGQHFIKNGEINAYFSQILLINDNANSKKSAFDHSAAVFVVCAKVSVCVTGAHGELVFEDLATEIVEALFNEFSSSILLKDSFVDTPEFDLIELFYELNRRGRPVVVVLRLIIGLSCTFTTG